MAAKQFKVPRSTLQKKVKNKKSTFGKVLSVAEEELLVTWITKMKDAGFPVTKAELINSVKKLITELKRDNPFTDNKPGRS